MEIQPEIARADVREFLSREFELRSWDSIMPYFENLKDRSIGSIEDLEKWMQDLSELESYLSEEAGWRYIRMNIDTKDEKAAEDFNFMVTEIDPKAAPYADLFNRKLMENEWTPALDHDKYFTYLRSITNQIKIYREENIPLMTELQQLQQEYGNITGNMSIEHAGKQLTMQAAGKLLKDHDRDLRRSIFHKLMARRAEASDQLNDLFSKLITQRDRVAKNSGFSNFRDYKFAALDRFDYSVNDCEQFHESVKAEVTPLLNELNENQRNALGLRTLKPWDTDVDPQGEQLKPFAGADDLTERTIKCFGNLRPYYAECLTTMRNMGHLDLESRMGKAPGGFNYPLYETGVPFIFMNAVGTVRDMITMIHEGGHAVHAFLCDELELCAFKQVPSEVAELASMAMELLTFDHWNEFFSDPKEEIRAKKEHLEKVISVLPWVATVDKFQHWIYENPKHNLEQRAENWITISDELMGNVVDWSDDEEFKKMLWQKQLHIFEVPFYYIEYGIAQLGAIAMWKQYRENPEQALNNYEKALAMGYTRPIGEIYAAAGIEFNFTRDYVRELVSFVWNEYKKLG